MTPEQLDEIERRAMAANKDLWEVASNDPTIVLIYSLNGLGEILTDSREDAAFIAAARTDVPALIAALRAEKERVRELESALRPFASTLLLPSGQAVGLERDFFRRAAALLDKGAENG